MIVALEAGHLFEEEGYVPFFLGEVEGDILQDGLRPQAVQLKKVVQKLNARLVNVVGVEVGQVGEFHPGQGQGVEATGDVEENLRLASDGENLLVELCQNGQAFASGEVVGHDLPAGLADEGRVLGGVGGGQGGRGRAVIRIAQVRGHDAVQSGSHCLHRRFDLLVLPQGFHRQGANRRLAGVAVLFGLLDGGDNGGDQVGVGHRKL